MTINQPNETLLTCKCYKGQVITETHDRPLLEGIRPLDEVLFLLSEMRISLSLWVFVLMAKMRQQKILDKVAKKSEEKELSKLRKRNVISLARETAKDVILKLKTF